jgi:hypothetical protein
MASQVTQIDRPSGTRVTPAVSSTTRTASDATGINLENRGPINPNMPQLPPA